MKARTLAAAMLVAALSFQLFAQQRPLRGAEDAPGHCAGRRRDAACGLAGTRGRRDGVSGQALVTREVDVKGGPGLVEIVVPGLPPQTLDSSLYTEGTKEIRVLSTRYRTRAIKEDIREEVRAKEQSLRELQQKTQELQKSIEVQTQDTQLLSKLETFTGATMKELMEKGMLNPDATVKLSQFIMDQRGRRAKHRSRCRPRCSRRRKRSRLPSGSSRS